MLGDIAYPLFAAYSASKFAVRGLSIALRRELKPYGIGVTYAAPRATKTDASHAMDPLVEPLQMRLDDPTAVASQIWRAVAEDRDSIYAKGPERLFVLAQRFLPKLVDRAISAQMLDERVRDYLKKSLDAAGTRSGAMRWREPTKRRLRYEIFPPTGAPGAARLCATAARSAIVVHLITLFDAALTHRRVFPCCHR